MHSFEVLMQPQSPMMPPSAPFAPLPVLSSYPMSAPSPAQQQQQQQQQQKRPLDAAMQGIVAPQTADPSKSTKQPRISM
jgi:hypothetical protein